MKNKRKLNLKKVFGLIIFIILIIVLVSQIINSKDETDIENKNVSIVNQNMQNEEIENSVVEEETTESNTDYLSNLSVPVYKKDEKNIKIPILIYHAFGTPMPDDDIYNLFSCQANFEENVSTILNDGYTFITLEDLYRYNNGEIGLPEKVMIITCDDGWLGCYTEAFPILKKYNIPMTVFIVNKLVGTNGYFSWEQAKEMYDSGLVKIHCHGYSHIEYGSVSKEKLQSDYEKSHQEIVDNLQDDSIQKIMAYPAGKSTENSIQWLKEIGFEIQVQTKYGTVNKSDTLDLTGLGRIRAEKATGQSILNIVNSK